MTLNNVNSSLLLHSILKLFCGLIKIRFSVTNDKERAVTIRTLLLIHKTMYAYVVALVPGISNIGAKLLSYHKHALISDRIKARPTIV